MSPNTGNKRVSGGAGGNRGNSLRAQEQSRSRKLRIRLFWLVVLPATLIVAFWGWATRPVSKPSRPIRLAVAPHSSLFQTGATLQNEGVIRSALAFAITARLEGKSSMLKAGRYKFSGDLALDQVIDRLAEGPNDSAFDHVKVTVPEGYTIDQIDALLTSKGVLEAKQFQKFVSDPGSIASLQAEFPLPHTSLEGYLFPDTYEFLPHSSVGQIVNEMLMNFGRRFYRPYQPVIDAAPGGLNAIVIKASLIEREARVELDRPRIAGVLENRLKKNMKLQVDASVLYGVAHKTRVMNADLKRDSPYNTYLHSGLPAGPIANPGINSLMAALHPESNDFLYYVARPSGVHVFTRTFAEHEAAVKSARLEWKASGGAYGAAAHE